MNRRDFLRNSALVMAGMTAVQQMEFVERLLHKRKFFPSTVFDGTHGHLELFSSAGLLIGTVPWNGETHLTPLLSQVYDRQLFKRAPRYYRMIVQMGTPQFPMPQTDVVRGPSTYTIDLPRGLPRGRTI